MSLQKLMQNCAEFNLWANQVYAAWLGAKPSELLYKEIPSSYPSIMLTLMHIKDTERFWLSQLKSLPPTPFDQEFAATITEALSDLVKQSELFRDYISSQTEANFEETFKLDMPWMKGEVSRYEIIQHCLNHSTYHRGQIVTIGRNFGITDPPWTDYNYYNMVIRTKK